MNTLTLRSVCPRNPFAIYGDTETEMRKRIEQMGHDDDWDEIHLPQAIEFNVKTDYPEIFKISIFLFTTRFKEVVEEYFKLFEKKDEKGMSFKEYVKETNFEINPSKEKIKKYEEGKTCWCGYPFDDEFFENADDEDEEPKMSPLYKKINRRKR